MEIFWTVMTFLFVFGTLALVGYVFVHMANVGRRHQH
jgi:hypothetical protein